METLRTFKCIQRIPKEGYRIYEVIGYMFSHHFPYEVKFVKDLSVFLPLPSKDIKVISDLFTMTIGERDVWGYAIYNGSDDVYDKRVKPMVSLIRVDDIDLSTLPDEVLINRSSWARKHKQEGP